MHTWGISNNIPQQMVENISIYYIPISHLCIENKRPWHQKKKPPKAFSLHPRGKLRPYLTKKKGHPLWHFVFSPFNMDFVGHVWSNEKLKIHLEGFSYVLQHNQAFKGKKLKHGYFYYFFQIMLMQPWNMTFKVLIWLGNYISWKFAMFPAVFGAREDPSRPCHDDTHLTLLTLGVVEGTSWFVMMLAFFYSMILMMMLFFSCYLGYMITKGGA